jgi:ABC-type transporter Mla subunit MlaD
MSLGPPFDSSGERLQQAVGAVVVVLLAAAIGWVLIFSGRTLGSGITVHVKMGSTGLLRTGAKVRVAGDEAGEVRAVYPRLSKTESGVTFEVFLLRGLADRVRKNSLPFVSSPSVLGEAYLEFGPPEGGAPPGPPVADGDTLTGAEPPDLDRFFLHAEASIREVMRLLHENRGELDELLAAADGLLKTFSSLPADRGQFRRIADQLSRALDSGRGLLATIRDAGGVDRLKRDVSEIGAIADEAGPQLRDLGTRLDEAMERIEKLRALFPPERRDDVTRAVATFRRAATLGEKIVEDVKWIIRRIESGEGSVGAFLADKEIFDDFHETHRIIKAQGLRFLLKPVDPKAKVAP